ncbi:MAG: DUF58 domain-containing protein [Chloroflexi bacterium]|nr:DUF58 domain-containing protein [Chloroflexota bacterium]
MTKRSIPPALVFGVVLLFALTTGFDALFRMSYVLGLALVAGFLWAWAGLRGIGARFESLTARTEAGRSVEEKVLVSNRSLFSRSRLEIEVLCDLAGHPAPLLVDLPARARKDSHWVMPEISVLLSTHCPRRGLYHFGPIKIAASDPLGFFKIARLFARKQEVIVHPAAEEIPGFHIPFSEARGDKNIPRLSHLTALQAFSVREYVQGDGINRVHWPSTAKHGKLMVKEFEAGRSSRVWLIMDMGHATHESELETDDLTAMVSASIAKRINGLDMPVGLVSYAQSRLFVPAHRGQVHLTRIMDALALARPDGAGGLEMLLVEEERYLGSDDHLVIVTPSTDLRWVRLLEGIKRRHASLLVVLVDGRNGEGRRGEILSELSSRKIPARIVCRGVPLSDSLSSTVLSPREAAVTAGAETIGHVR